MDRALKPLRSHFRVCEIARDTCRSRIDHLVERDRRLYYHVSAIHLAKDSNASEPASRIATPNGSHHIAKRLPVQRLECPEASPAVSASSNLMQDFLLNMHISTHCCR